MKSALPHGGRYGARDMTALASEPPLGNFMFLIAVAIQQLDVKSSGMKISRFLDDELKVNSSPAQIYVALQRMQSAGWIDLRREVKSKYGPPQKIYCLTDEGIAAVHQKAAHISALSAFVERYHASTALTGIVGANQNAQGLIRGDKPLAKDKNVSGAAAHGRKKVSPPNPHQGRPR